MDGITQHSRPPHEQTITEDDATDPLSLDHLQIICWVDITSMKMDRHGGMEWKLVIPPEFVDRGFQLRGLAGFPLSADFQRWKVVEPEDDDE